MIRFVLAVALSSAIPAYGASFECASAARRVETMICEDAELSALDDILASDYREADLEYRATGGTADERSLLRDQRAWLKRRNACGDHPCIRDAYVSRIRELRLAVCEVNPGRRCEQDELEIFPTMRASQDELRTRYCMIGSRVAHIKKPCTQEQSDYVVTHTRIAHGDEEFCRELLSREFTLMDLPYRHFVSDDEAKDYLELRAGDTAIHPGAGRFDINNDGRTENLGWISASSGAGQGCTVQRFVELDDRRVHILDSELTDVLAIQTCRDYYRAFQYKGKTYLENRRSAGLPSGAGVQLLSEVIELVGPFRRYVCEFAYEPN